MKEKDIKKGLEFYNTRGTKVRVSWVFSSGNIELYNQKTGSRYNVDRDSMIKSFNRGKYLLVNKVEKLEGYEIY